jgi:hypothetical protein
MRQAARTTITVSSWDLILVAQIADQWTGRLMVVT